MKKLLSLILLVAVLGVAAWLWTVCFPNPKQAVRNRLNQVAQLASFSANQGNIMRVANVQKLGRLFAEDVQVMVDIPGTESHTFTSREELMQIAMAANRLSSGLKAEFLDINIEMGTGDQSALADLTLKAKVGGESDLIVQELKFTLKKIDGDWLITRVETLRALKP
jgi:hypothetical protein